MPQRASCNQQRLIAALLLAIVLGAGLQPAAGKICPSTDVRNYPEKLKALTNCTIISGFLRIALLNNAKLDSKAFDSYQFPALVEISQYLVFYSVNHLRSIGQLFPNLRVIRGLQLMSDYSLAIYVLPHLEEISLTNLLYVQRGNVFIQRTPNLCNVDTIDWKRIGFGSLSYDQKQLRECLSCNTSLCTGDNCWSENQCQKKPVNHCHEQCYGCTRPNSPKHCLSCRNYDEDGLCVGQCSNKTYVHENARKCLTYDECHSILKGTHFAYQRQCIDECPLDHRLVKNKTEAKSDDEICEYCGFNCDIECATPEILETLQNLERFIDCNIIKGDFKLRISEELDKELENRGFLLRVTEIHGQLTIGRSPTIKSLDFLKNLRFVNGSSNAASAAIYIYENANLERLWNYTDNFKLKIGHGHIAIYNNQKLCYSEIEKFANATNLPNRDYIKQLKDFNGNRNTCNGRLDLNITQKIIHATNATFIWPPIVLASNMTAFYTIVYSKTSDNRSRDLADSDGGCNPSWNSKFVQESNKTSVNVTLTNLEPYTAYEYYFKIFGDTFSTETVISSFTTDTDDPSPPEDFTAVAVSDTSIALSWKQSSPLNGNFSHYAITMLHEVDYLDALSYRDFCKYPHTNEETESSHEINIQKLTTTTMATWTNGTGEECACAPQDEEEKSISPSIKFFKLDMYTKFQKRSTFAPQTSQELYDSYFPIYNVNTTQYLVENLTHHNMYLFFLQGCNHNQARDRDECSGIEMTFARTHPNPHADAIPHFDLLVKNRDLNLRWPEPPAPNSYIVAYGVDLNRTDSQHYKFVHECVTRFHFIAKSRSFQIPSLEPGVYAVRVQAVSLAGPAAFSPWRTFEIQSSAEPTAALVVAIVFTVLTVLLTAGGLAWYRYKKRYAFDTNHLITSVNPDYAGPIYVEDEWELERADIELLRPIGQGSFGQVFEGHLRSRNWPCAVKTVTEAASLTSRMEFLNEGSVMKSSNTGHHVVKLLGIVSRGQPPYVVMELMERGDLKSYLRRCRGPSQNLTVNEVYRMAAEIADGMAYLAAKKVVHRDLATRNCMVGGDRTVKIGDFGMARDIYETDYYRKDTVGLLPVRWMAPESLSDGVFTTDSDVWSYGIVLWEMATLAEQPYQGLSNEQVFHFVKNRGRLERPLECSDLLFEVMDACWCWRPNDRPTFPTIVERFAEHVGEGFKLVAFCYSRQGQEHAVNCGPRVYNPPAMELAKIDENYWQNEEEDDETVEEEEETERLYEL